MPKRTFSVRAVWDDEAKVFYSESDIDGLHIETASLDEFEGLLQSLAVELIFANHITKDDLANLPVQDLVPAILWQKPENPVVAA